MGFDVKPKIEAHPITVEDLLNYGLSVGSNSAELAGEMKKRFEEALNQELSRAFEAGVEYAKSTAQCRFNKI